jgi:alkylhydroperoxidase family enzyme
MEQEPRVSRLGREDVAGPVAELFDAFVRERGKIPNLFRVAAHRPEIVSTLRAHMNAVMGPGTVDVLLKELVAIQVSHINNCEY